MEKSEKFFVFEGPMQRFGFFLMSATSFLQYKKEILRFEALLEQQGIDCRPNTSKDAVILVYK